MEVSDPIASNAQLSQQGSAPDGEKKLEAMVRSLAVLMAKISLRETSRAFEDGGVKDYQDRIVPYLAAVDMLAFTGRDIDSEGIIKLVRSIGIIPESNMVDKVIALRFKNSLVYASAVYFLVSAGKEPTVDMILLVIRALDMHPDSSLAGYAITLYRLYKDASL